jgi:hypothetical protein
VGAAAAIVLVLVAGAIAATWQARLALRQEARAEEVQAFIASVFTEADPMQQNEGQALSATQLLLQAEKRLKERTDASPGMRVEMLTIIGESLVGLQAEEAGARVLEDALRLHDALPDADPALSTRIHLALTLCRESEEQFEVAQAHLAKAFAALRGVRKPGRLAVRVRLEESALALSTQDFDVTIRAAHQAIAEVVGARVVVVENAQNVEQGALTRPGRAHDRHQLTALDPQIHVAQHVQRSLAAAIRLIELLETDHRHGSIAAAYAKPAVPAVASPPGKAQAGRLRARQLI